MRNEVTFYCSGSNHGGEIRGLSLAGCHVGVAANELKANAERELLALAGTPARIFVDSGAFAEVHFPEGRLEVKTPITHEEWLSRLDLYRRLASELGSQVVVVAPDMVGNQVETLRRLRRYAGQMAELRELGAEIIVPIQRGRRSMIEFDRACSAALGFSDYVRGVPLKKAATTHEAYEAFVSELPFGTRVHLLGKGPNSHDYAHLVSMSKHLVLSCDAVRIRALVGRTNGPGGGPRALTAASDEVRAELGHGATAFEVKCEAIRRVFATEGSYEPTEVAVAA
jgi:hypothetical protein